LRCDDVPADIDDEQAHAALLEDIKARGRQRFASSITNPLGA